LRGGGHSVAGWGIGGSVIAADCGSKVPGPRMATTPGNLGNLLEFKNPPGNLEFNWSSGNFCARCQRSTALVSSHKTGYQIIDCLLKKLGTLF